MKVHKFSVPDHDQIVEKWVDSQSNISMSVRMLINMFVTEHGYQDVTCMSMGFVGKRRGRPSKNLKSPYGDTPPETGYSLYETDADDLAEEAYAEEVPVPVQERRPVRRQAVQENRRQMQSYSPMPEPVETQPEPVQPAVTAKKQAAAPPAAEQDDMLNMFAAPPEGSIGGALDDMLDDDGFVDPDDLLG